MKRKIDITVGVVEKVREYYVSKPLVANLIKIDRIRHTIRYGDEIHVYYDNISQHDRVYINGIEHVPKEQP